MPELFNMPDPDEGVGAERVSAAGLAAELQGTLPTYN